MNKSTPLHALLLIIIYTSILKWYIPLSIRINYYDVAILLFIFYFLASCKKLTRLSILLENYIYLTTFWCLICIFSGIIVLFYPIGEFSLVFYYKGILQLIVYSIFLVLLVFYLNQNSSAENSNFLKHYVWAVIFSGIYGFSQLLFKYYFDFDIDEYISGIIFRPINVDVSVERHAYGSIYRLTGFASDPSIHAAYTLTAIPFLYMIAYYQKSYFYYFATLMVLFSLILTLSGSSFIGFLAILFLISLFKFNKIIRNHLLQTILFSVIFIFWYILFSVEINKLASVKFSSNGTISDHILIAYNSLKLFYDFPFGVGYNNFSIAYQYYNGEQGYNSHNSWLTYLTEMGLFGFCYQITFSVYIIYTTLIIKSRISNVFIVSYLCVCVASLGYEIKNAFFFILFTTLFYSILIIEHHRKKNRKLSSH